MGVIAGVIAMVPLGLVLLTSVAFAVGGVRLASHNVLIQELAAVEGLARVDVLCMDKTGTLTEGGLVFDAVHPLTPEPGWEQVLAWFGAEPEANATARCLSTAFEDDGGLQPVSSVPFSSARKWSGVSFDGRGRAAQTWILGAPEMVLAQADDAAWRPPLTVPSSDGAVPQPADDPHPTDEPSHEDVLRRSGDLGGDRAAHVTSGPRGETAG